MRLCGIAIGVLLARRADADVAMTAGASAGLTLASFAYFPTYTLGAKAVLERPLVGAVSAGLEARVQIYRHFEEEDFGSRGFEADLCAVVRFHVFAADAADSVNPFVAVRFGGAGVLRVPDSSADSVLLGGYLGGASVGLDVQGDHPRTRVEVSFDLPSFDAFGDQPGPLGELSLVVSGRLY